MLMERKFRFIEKISNISIRH